MSSDSTHSPELGPNPDCPLVPLDDELPSVTTEEWYVATLDRWRAKTHQSIWEQRIATNADERWHARTGEHQSTSMHNYYMARKMRLANHDLGPDPMSFVPRPPTPPHLRSDDPDLEDMSLPNDLINYYKDYFCKSYVVTRSPWSGESSPNGPPHQELAPQASEGASTNVQPTQLAPAPSVQSAIAHPAELVPTPSAQPTATSPTQVATAPPAQPVPAPNTQPHPTPTPSPTQEELLAALTPEELESFRRALIRLLERRFE